MILLFLFILIITISTITFQPDELSVQIITNPIIIKLRTVSPVVVSTLIGNIGMSMTNIVIYILNLYKYISLSLKYALKLL